MVYPNSVLLVTEGTYPGAIGGVSEWCHRLITGMPNIDFKIISITSSDTLPRHQQLPHNVSELILLPLWDIDSRFYRYSHNSNLKKEIIEYYRKDLHWSKSRMSRQNIVSGGDIYESPLKNAIHKIKHFPVPAAFVIHAMNLGLAGLLGLEGKRQHKIPLIITEHGSYYKEWLLSTYIGECVSKERCWGTNLRKYGRSEWILGQIEQLIRNVLAGADLILPVTSAHVPWELYFGARPDQIKIIPNGVDSNKFQPGSFENTDRIMIGSMCRITPIKDLHTLIIAANHLIKQVPRVEFHLVGPVENKQYYLSCCNMIEDLGLDDRVLFHQATHKPVEWYHQFDLFALSSISEGMPLVLLEAMSTGTPSVATDVGGVREVIGGFNTVIPARQPETFAKALSRTLNMNMHKQSLQVRRIVQNRFSQKQMIQEYANIYNTQGIMLHV